MEKEIIEKIEHFTKLSNEFTESLRVHYGVEMPLYEAWKSGLIPHSGIVTLETNEKLNFRLHGSGCEFVTGYTLVDVNYVYLDMIYETYLFSAFKLLKFINSINKNVALSEQDCHFLLKKLVKKGVLGTAEGSFFLKN